ncbi:chromosome partitioning protein ParA [Planctomycetales bacterium]|nr:chromosome partitioning protein ParA [Planctomycetales bacterium]
MRVFCIANQKGGVGKTTTAVSLADAFAKTGARTLLVDFDPQCNATSGLFSRFEEKLLSEHPLTTETREKAIVATSIPNLDILPGSRNIAVIEVLARMDDGRLAQITETLRQIIDGYDYVFFDCPPSLGQLTQLALSVSEEILIPMQCDYYSMIGLAQQMDEVIKLMKKRQDNALNFGGVVLTMYDAGLELTYEAEQEIRDFCGDIALTTVIPRDAVFLEAPSHGIPILEYAPRCRGARAYTELCMELAE